MAIISEDAPNKPQVGAGAADKFRRQARQLAYDVRYKVKQSFKDGQKTDAASLKRAYISQLGNPYLLLPLTGFLHFFYPTLLYKKP